MLKNKKPVIIIVISVFFIVLIIKNYKDRQAISESGVYVIGTVEKTKGAYKGIRTFVSYRYRGKQIKSDFVSNDIVMSDQGKRFFFKINPQYPSKYQIEYKVIVPDSLQESPYNGWDTLPVALYQVK